MSRFVEGCDRRQPTLLPECLDDYVAEENPVRVVDVFVDEMDLASLGFEVMPAATGRPAYHPAMEAVARMAGVSTATLYAYFPSKADLFKAIVLETVSGIAAPVREAVRTKGDARTRLTALAVAYATFLDRKSVV